jgi:RNA polymerase sigma factor (sigma-70 family)
MKINDLSAQLLTESFFSGWGDVKKPAQIRAFIIGSVLEWYDDNGGDWSYGLLPEMLANYMEAINAKGNESPEMTKVIKAAMKQIMEQYHEMVDESYLEERADQFNTHIERLKRLDVYPDLLTALQKSMAAALKDEQDRWESDEDDDLDEAKQIDPALVYDTDAEMDKRELYALVNRFKTTLNPRTAKIIDMYIDGKTFKDIGKDIGITGNRVKQLYAMGLRQLKGRMNVDKNTDIGHLYGYRKTPSYDIRRGVAMHPADLWNDIKDNPTSKIVKITPSMFTIVPKDDPRPEIIYDVDLKEKVAELKKQIHNLKIRASRLQVAAHWADKRISKRPWDPEITTNRNRLEKEPAYQRIFNQIAAIEKKLSIIDTKQTWYTLPSNKV